MICTSCRQDFPGPGEVCPACVQGATTTSVYVGSVVASRYELQMPLGRGGMGIVFKAHDRVLDETVALKLLRADMAANDDMARRFRSEIKLARKVRHPNVCAIHEYGEGDGLSYISMEFVAGTDVKRVLRENGAFPAPKALDVALQTAAGLQAIHDVGVVHRDLKSSNVMLDENGRVLLMDFGIAKQLGGDATLGGTMAGMVVGTPEYMSPEQARADKVDFRSDIYALGILIFELFTGHVPFQGQTPIATIFKHLQEPPPLDGPLARPIPASVVPVLRRALAKEPDQRYQSAAETARALEQARAALGTPSLPDPGSASTAVGIPTVVSTSVGATRIETPAATPPTRLTPEPAWRPDVPAVKTRQPTSGGKLAGLVLGASAFVLVVAGGIVWKHLTREDAPRPETPASLAPPTTTQALPPPTQPAAPVEPVQAEASAPQATWNPPREPEASPPVSVPTRPAATPATAPVATSPTGAAAPPPVATSPPRPPVQAAATPSAPPATQAPAMPRPARPAPKPAAATGFVQFHVRPWAEVSIDGKVIGTTPLKAVRVSAGQHSLRFVHPDYKPVLRKVLVSSGKTVKVELDLAWEAVRKLP